MLCPPGWTATDFRVSAIPAPQCSYDLFPNLCMCDGSSGTFSKGESGHFPALTVPQRLHFNEFLRVPMCLMLLPCITDFRTIPHVCLILVFWRATSTFQIFQAFSSWWDGGHQACLHVWLIFVPYVMCVWLLKFFVRSTIKVFLALVRNDCHQRYFFFVRKSSLFPPLSDHHLVWIDSLFHFCSWEYLIISKFSSVTINRLCLIFEYGWFLQR